MQSINYIGAFTLYQKEVHRFIKVYNQTLIAPLISALLFLAVFKLALGNRLSTIGTIPFGEFIASGLIMMSVMQNAFANSSSSFIMGKVLGNIIDYLTPPLSPFELVFAMVMAGITRGVAVGLLVFFVVSFVEDLTVHSYLLALFFLISSSMLLALFGIFAGIIAETFDQMAAVNSYLITPLAFLSGTFYSVHSLPQFFYSISQFNPFFYMIDGFRFGMSGYADSNIVLGVVIVVATNALMWLVVQTLIAKGYRIKN